jgi:hypothetical protein
VERHVLLGAALAVVQARGARVAGARVDLEPVT